MAVERAGENDRWLSRLDRIVALICACGLALVIPLSDEEANESMRRQTEPEPGPRQ